MHQCDEFREQITDHIIDRENLAENAEFQRELLTCSACSEFYLESRDVIEALSSVDLSMSERQWHGIEHRLRMRIISAPPAAREAQARAKRERDSAKPQEMPAASIREAQARAKRERDSAKPQEMPATSIREAQARQRAASINDRRETGAPRSASAIARSLNRRAWLQVLAGAAMLLVTIGLYRLSAPLVNLERSATPATPAVYVDPSVSLDPVTVDFLEESELLLRNVMKITPNDMDDFADAQKVANGQLADIEQRKEAAADVPPVVDVMDTYETILRDIRNVDARSATEDIADIQSRIQRNGLIANIKAFQPGISPVSFGGR
jgi:hypothetical protein